MIRREADVVNMSGNSGRMRNLAHKHLCQLGACRPVEGELHTTPPKKVFRAAGVRKIT
jgi:hypothetical protein